ncbi:MAG TPA: DUF3080 family protein [Pseudomonadales bacterium]|jgi:hypothetical protein
MQSLWTSAVAGWCRRFALAGGVLVGVQCSGPPDNAFADYLSRVQRLLETDVSVDAEGSLPRYPNRGLLRRDVASLSIDVLDFIELHDCDLAGVVGFRNSPLGRLQTPSQRLGYESEWLAGARSCASDGVGWLEPLIAKKEAALPAVFWNATFAGEEFARLLGRFEASETPGAGYLLRELGDAYATLATDRFDLGGFERVLGALGSIPWLGQARRAWDLERRHLDAVAGALTEGLEGVCRNGAPTPKSRALVNVFQRYYVDALQPGIARRHGTDRDAVAAVAALVGLFGGDVPGEFAVWYGQVLAPEPRRSEWSRLASVRLEHAAAWNRLFARCGVDPARGLAQH